MSPHLSRALAGLALVLAVSAGSPLVSSTSAAALAGVDAIAAGPATETGADTSRSRFSYQLDAGQQVTDAFFVENPGSTPQAVTVYATDAFTDEAGSYSLLETGATPQEVGSWVQFAEGQSVVSLELEPGEQQVIPFTLMVPADARPGDHAGGLVVSAVTPGDQVSVDRRVATRLYARVKGELQAALTITSITASYTPDLNPFGGRTTVSYTITNGGNVSLGADVVAQVKGLLGIPLGELDTAKIPELFPGDTRTVTAEIEGVGPWVYLTPSIDLVATIDVDALNPGPMPTGSRETTLFVVPWALLTLIALALVAWFVMRTVRSRNEARAREWVAFNEAEARRKAEEAVEWSSPAPVGDTHVTP